MQKQLQPFFDYESVTRETFNTPEAYEYVLNQPDKFTQQIELGKLSDAGKKVGVQNVKGLFKSFVESIKYSNANDCAITEFSDLPSGLELQTGRWNATDEGIWRHGTKGSEDIIACSHPILPVKRFRNIDTGLEKILIEFSRGAFRRTQVMVDRSTIASTRQITELADHGISVTSENASALVEYLQDMEAYNYDRIKTIKSTTRMGWVSKDVFLPYDDNIMYDGDVNYKHLFDSLIAEGDFETWLDTVRDARRKDIAVRIGLAASFASVLLEKINSLSMFAHFWSSGSATGKTVILMLAASIWGDPELGRLTQSFNTTEVASEWTCAFLNSIPLIMDELRLAQDKFGKSHFNVYKISQGVGRARGRKTGGIQSVSNWKLCCITSGETPLTTMSDGAGAFARIVDVEIADKIFSLEEGQAITKVIRKNHGHAGRMFVEKLIELGDEELQARHNQIMKDINHADKIQDKQRMAAAALLLADEIADEIIFHDDQGRLTFTELKPYLVTTNEISPNTRALAVFMDNYSVNRKYFEDDLRYEHHGFYDKENGYIYMVRSKFNELMRDHGFSDRAVLSAWHKQGLILTEERGGKLHYVVRRRNVQGEDARYVAVKVPDNDQEEEWLGNC